ARPAELDAAVVDEGRPDRCLLVVEHHVVMILTVLDRDDVALRRQQQLPDVAVDVRIELHESRQTFFQGEIGLGLWYFGICCSPRRNSIAAASSAASSWCS